MEYTFTPGWKLFKFFDILDTTSQLNFTFYPRFMCGDTENNIINTVGLQWSYSTIKSPFKYCRAILTHSILDYIETHIKKYGEDRCKHWRKIYCFDLIDFIRSLFLYPIRKRKIKPLIGYIMIHYWITWLFWQEKVS